MDFLNDIQVLALDTETTGLRYPRDRAFGFSIATPRGFSSYWDIRRQPEEAKRVIDAIASWKGRVVCHNAAFDFKMLRAADLHLCMVCLDDTVVRQAQINEHEHSYELDHLVKKYLKKEKDTTIYQQMAELFGGLATRNVQIGRIKDAPPEIVAPYVIRDAELALELWAWQEEKIQNSREKLQEIVEFERSLIPEFICNQIQGIRVEVDKAVQAAEEIHRIIPVMQRELNDLLGAEVNVDSSPQVKKLFNPYQKGTEWFVRQNGTEYKIGTTPKGGASLRADYLLEMAESGSRAADLIVQLRSLRKTADTFLLGHVVEHSHNGRVYPNINQSRSESGGVLTGRLSYVDPALQQIPSRNKKVAAIVKDVFLPDEGHVWVDYDADGFEVLVFAHLINDPALNAAYQNDPSLDLHQYVANLTGLPRNPPRGGAPNGKQLNLSMIFNQGEGATAEKMGLPWEWNSFEARDGTEISYKKAGPEAKRIIALYHNKVPGVKKLMKKYRDCADKYGYIKTRTGRVIRFPRGFKTYKASGLAIQATAADENKKNWVRIRKALDPIGGRLLLNTHDSYGTSVPEEYAVSSQEMVREAISSATGLRIPIRISCSGYGSSWWESVKGDD